MVGSVYLYSCTNNSVVICTGTLPRSIHALISSSIICLHFTAYCTVPCWRPCHVHCGGRGWDQHQLPQCQWQAAQLCQPHFTSDCWYIFSRSQGRFGTFFSKSFDQLLEADGEDTNLVFSPTPSLLGDHCMRVLHLAEPNFAWGQQPKPQGYSTVGQKEMMVTGVSENTTLFSFLSGKYCISSVYLLDISHHPQTPQTWRRTAWAPPTMLRSHSWHQPPPSRWKMAMYITLFTMKEFSQSPTSMFQIARNRPEALIALHTQVQHTLET